MGANHETTFDRLSEFVSQVMEKKGVSGVALGVLHNGEVSAAGFGVTNVDHPLPVTDETLFQIGSITKTFTGTAMMRLVEMGKVDLDATVRTYLPDFKVADEAASSQATVRHLLTHTGGWVGDFFHDTGAGDDALPKYVADMADLEQLASLGTVWSYNNAGFAVAGNIIEVVTGEGYQTALRELVLEPLGLEQIFFDPGDLMTYRFAVGHNAGEEGAQVARPWPLPKALYPVGGITCHLHDLLRYARFHLGDGRTEDGTELLKPESLAQMQAPQVTLWGKESWGLTWAVREVDGTRQLSHGGGTTGQISLLALIPEHDFAIAIFTNADRGGEITLAVSRWALKEYLGLKVPVPEPIEASEEQLRAYVGRYSRPFADIELGMLGGRLVGQMTYNAGFPTKDSPPPPPPPPMTLALCEKDRLVALDGPFKEATADVVRRPDGSIGWLRASGRIHRRET
jgi:CubicO group peptidase (beta-lactamase class C family)